MFVACSAFEMLLQRPRCLPPYWPCLLGRQVPPNLSGKTCSSPLEPSSRRGEYAYTSISYAILLRICDVFPDFESLLFGLICTGAVGSLHLQVQNYFIRLSSVLRITSIGRRSPPFPLLAVRPQQYNTYSSNNLSGPLY